MHQLMLICRPGFEADAGQEITDQAAAVGVFGYFMPGKNNGLVRIMIGSGETGEELMGRLGLDDLVFVRDWFLILGDCPLPTEDRVGAVIDFLRELGWPGDTAHRLEVRLPETSEDRDLGNFARKWVSPLSKGLRGAGLLQQKPGAPAQLEIMVLDFANAVVGVSLEHNRSPFAGGIPRLRLPATAPSRSALKLEEAWKLFIPSSQWLDYLGDGKKAVDLGAAPGGWTWQLVKEGMLVTAVDNGPMNPELMASGQVEHVRADGYSWRPKRGVDWMVCDIVDQPRKTAHMAVGWVGEKLCRYAIFNLKLPMKKRYEEWLICREIIEQGLERAGVSYRLRAHHLYHDREEITCFIERLP